MGITVFPGWAMNPGVFQLCQQQLGSAGEFTVQALPGYPGSEIEAGLTLQSQIRHLAKRVPAGVLVGWSLGGVYAALLAAQYPERYSKLILVSVSPCFVVRKDWPLGMSASRFEEFSASIDDGESLLRRFLLLQLHGHPQAKQLISAVLPHLKRYSMPAVAVLQQGLNLLREMDLRPVLEGLDQPVLVLLGQKDRLVKPEVADYYNGLGASVSVRVWPEVGHVPMVTHCPQFLEACGFEF